ncbi:hypothetical protein JTE90_013772 [Oedothorax gibbosus]|uniref:Large ribosomal subunit protein eL28 n=1 Tax=Oedothorax gibbosus TaxID=931172 RepID=A0AAV6UYH9_9ARAC|nr:hypothetical protein JTE90_013772 [Oedothorax gibbosus]
MIKKRNIKKPFSTDPLNMKKVHAPRFIGTIQNNAIMVEPHSSKKGVNFIVKKKRFHRKPARTLLKTPMTRNAARTMKNIKTFVRVNKYRKDLKMLALRRASAILKSQRPVVLKKKTFKKKAE